MNFELHFRTKREFICRRTLKLFYQCMKSIPGCYIGKYQPVNIMFYMVLKSVSDIITENKHFEPPFDPFN